MLDIPGLGPKKIKALHDELGIETVEAIGTGVPKTAESPSSKVLARGPQTNILEGINRRRSYASKHLLSEALPAAEPLLEALRQHPDVFALQRRRQLAAAPGGHRRHRPAGILEASGGSS